MKALIAKHEMTPLILNMPPYPFIPEQFTVKAHPALFEGKGKAKKLKNTFIPGL